MRLALPAAVALAASLVAARDARADEPARDPPSKPVGESSAPRSNALVVAGAFTLAAGYAPALGLGLASLGYGVTHLRVCFGCGPIHDDATWMVVPLVGPLVYAGSDKRDDGLRREAPSSTERALLVTSAALQAAGVVMIVVGSIVSSSRPRAPIVTPMMTTGGAGVGIASTF